LFIPLASAEVDNYYGYSELIIDYEFNTEVELDGGNDLDYLNANLTLIPLESYRQEVISFYPNSNPVSEIVHGDTFLNYIWNEYNPIFQIGIESSIKSKSSFHKLDHISFPIIDLDENYQMYLQEGEKIDITDDIVNKAAEIVAGEDDLYTAVFKLADWTRNNIEYDLNSLTAKAALKSSWVLENRQGVCDEMTSLFISFCRSVGIPARFISGTAYTNVDYSFGNHGWAEVYFPDHGWVPYDVTFGEYSWLNPAHISLAKSLDSGDSAIKYSWMGNNIDIETTPIIINAEVVSEGDYLEPIFDIDVDFLVDQVAPGSYVPVRVSIDNNFDKYVTNTIFITKSPSPLAVKDNPRPILMKPNQEKSSFWTIKVPSDVDPGYVYTSTFEVKDIFGSISSDTLEFSQQYELFTQDEALSLIEGLEEEEDMTYSENIFLECSSSKDYYYFFEKVKINCEVQNIGNTLISELRVCLYEECEDIDLNIAQKKNIFFNTDPSIGNLAVSAKNSDLEVYSFINFLILDSPDLEVSNFEFKDIVSYNDKLDISFVLSSKAIINNLEIVVGGLEPINIEKTKESIPVSINTDAKYFIDRVDLVINYEDEYGNKFSIEEFKSININDIPWYARFFNLFRRIF